MPTTARERLLSAAVEAFAEKGFAATTTRDIASRAGMSPAAVYVHHDSKESLFFQVSLSGHQETLELVERSAARTDDPVERLRGLIYDFSLWHAQNSRVGRIVQYEFNALTPEHRTQIADYRRRIERVVRDVLADGVERGAFDVDDLGGTARALLSLGIDLLRWYSPGAGSRTPEDMAALHASLAVRMVTQG